MRDVAQFFKVLSDEARLQILWLLFNHEELCVCDLMATLETTQSKTSRHLSTLRHAGLVNDRRDGMWSYYTLKPLEPGIAKEQVELLKANLAKRPDAKTLLAKLKTHLATKNRPSVCANGGLCEAINKKPIKRGTRAA